MPTNKSAVTDPLENTHNVLSELAVESIENMRTLLADIAKGLETNRGGQMAEDGQVLATEAATLSTLLNLLRNLEANTPE